MTLLEVIVVLGAVGVLVWMILPMFARSKHGVGHSRIKCVNNLRQIGLAYKVFAGDNDDKYPFQTAGTLGFTNETVAWSHFQSMSNELQTAKVLLCPADAKRANQQAENFSWGSETNDKSLAHFGNGAISYFVGLDANEDKPTSILSGDHNLDTNRLGVLHQTVYVRNNNRPGWTGELHNECGNILLGDGSVCRWKNVEFGGFVQTNQMTLNRLLLPN